MATALSRPQLGWPAKRQPKLGQAADLGARPSAASSLRCQLPGAQPWPGLRQAGWRSCSTCPRASLHQGLVELLSTERK